MEGRITSQAKVRIVVDGRPFVKVATGVATFLRDIIRAICEYLPDWEILLVLPKEIHSSVTDVPLDKIHIFICPLLKWFKTPNFIWYHLMFPYVAWKLKADFIWGTNSELPFIRLGKAKRLVTVHDLVWKEFPKTMRWSAKYVSIPFLDRSILMADYIHCNSNYTDNLVRTYFPKRKCKDSVIGDSCSNLFQKREINMSKRKDLCYEFGISEKFVLFVGSLEPRKNLQFLIKLMPEVYKRTGAKLLVVGGKGWKNNNIHMLVDGNQEIQESVIFANYVSFEKLVELYNIATVYVSTSLNEGFGMPQLEAMSCGCPVIAPHNSAMIDIVSRRGVTIKGWEPKEWTDQIVKFLSDDNYRELFCHPDLEEFDWANIVRRIDNYLRKKEINNKQET